MAGLWPASSNQLDSNARGVALAWGSLLKGFNAQQIREAVLQLGEDADRQFAPRPAEVRAAILRNNPVPRAAPVGRRVSLRVCEMEAEVRVFMRERSVPTDIVAKELQQVLAEKSRQGVTVTGKVIGTERGCATNCLGRYRRGVLAISNRPERVRQCLRLGMDSHIHRTIQRDDIG